MKRQGEFIKNFSGDLEYYSFKPSNLPIVDGIRYDNELVNLISDSNKYLGLLEGISKNIPNKDLYITMYIRKEALLSNQIEGTQATIDDVFDPTIDKNTNLDVKEVFNYIEANNHSESLIHQLPISKRFIKDLHAVLLKDGRGSDKTPGEYRTTQNWIGPRGSTLKTANFIPPNVTNMLDSMNSLETYINEDDPIHNLIKISLIHYQFETIHPFLDGNGRIGRLLITTLLKEYKLLSNNVLYLSYFFKKNRVEYYDRLMEVRLKGDYEQWIKFFLRGVIETSKNAIECIDDLSILRKKNLDKINNFNKGSKNTLIRVFELIEEVPIIDIKEASKLLGRAYNTASKAINDLLKLGILVKANNYSRNRIYVYDEYLTILRDGTE